MFLRPDATLWTYVSHLVHVLDICLPSSPQNASKNAGDMISKSVIANFLSFKRHVLTAPDLPSCITGLWVFSMGHTTWC